MPSTDPVGREMLALSLLAYRGFWDFDTDDGEDIAGTIASGLEQLEPLPGRWRLVWGPSAWRTPGSFVDDSLLYVVQGTTDRSRFAVVVRGTNPLSGFDWLFGDFLASRQVPWRPGGRTSAADARISVSTHLGLAVLTHMRGRPSDDWGEMVPAFGWLSDLGEALWRKGGRLLRGLEEDVRKEIEELADDARERLAKLRAELRESRGDIARQVATLLAVPGQLLRKALLAVVDRLLDTLADGALSALLPLIEREGVFDDPTGGRITLLEFLGRVTSNPDIHPRITITGHSKGGVLSSTLALYLADLQGREDVPDTCLWDPKRRALVECYSFAGPTAGNAAFAAHSDAVLGDHCHRIACRLDVVPHAWNAASLLEIPHLYLPPTKAIPGLETLAAHLAEDLAPLDYRHVGARPDEFVEDVRPLTDTFAEQLLLQHLHAYIRHFELPLLGA